MQSLLEFFYLFIVRLRFLCCILHSSGSIRQQVINICVGLLFLGCVELGVPNEIGKGVHGSLGLLRFSLLHTGTLTRLVFNEGFSSAL
jgi:hypothetical protein